jgi:hypothetical protein
MEIPSPAASAKVKVASTWRDMTKAPLTGRSARDGQFAKQPDALGNAAFKGACRLSLRSDDNSLRVPFGARRQDFGVHSFIGSCRVLSGLTRILP